MDLKASSLMSFFPWVVMALGSTTAGLLADGLVRTDAARQGAHAGSACQCAAHMARNAPNLPPSAVGPLAGGALPLNVATLVLHSPMVPTGLHHSAKVRRGVPVLTVRRGIQTAAFLGPVAALMALANPAISPPLALLSMTAALGITSLGEQRAVPGVFQLTLIRIAQATCLWIEGRRCSPI